MTSSGTSHLKPGGECVAPLVEGQVDRAAVLVVDLSGLAYSALSWRASAFSLALDPLTPPLRSARRVTGFPAVTSLRATKDA